MPIDLRTLLASLTMSKPFTIAVPAVGLRIVLSIEITVVFPAPLGPSKPKISPFSTVILNSSTALKEPYVFVNWRVSITCGIFAFSLSAILEESGI
jgi:hypothetical protein